MHCHFRLIAPIAALFLLGGCNTQLDQEHRAHLEDMAKQAAAQDLPLTGKLDLSRPAILLLYRTGASSTLHPSCNGYCLRLLYNGEAKTVISGYLALPDALEQANVSQQAWRDPFIDAPGTKAGVLVYHLEKRSVCPEVWREESGPFRRHATDANDSNKTADQLADINMAAGLCLIAEPTKLDDASAVVTITDSTTSNTANDDHMQFDVMHVTAFAPSEAGLVARYRKTVSVYSYLPQFLPASFDNAQFKVTTVTDPRKAPEILRQDLGWRLADLTMNAIDLRSATDRLLNDGNLTTDSPRWGLVDDYLRGLSQPDAVTPEDVAVLERVITDTRLRGHLKLLGHALAYNKAASASLAEPLLRALVEDRPPAQGLSDLAEAFTRMPAAAVRKNQDLLLQLVADPVRIRQVPRTIAQVSAVDPQRAVPVLAGIVDADADPVATRMAMQAGCEMGQGAEPLKPAVQAWLTHHPETSQARTYTQDMTQRNARALLTNLVTPGTESCDHLSGF